MSEIVTVLIRILAINFGFYVLNSLFGLLVRPTYFTPRHGGGSPLLMEFLLIGILFLCAYWLWRLAPFFARQITRGQNSALSATHLTLLDLYTFAFLLVGLYFSVDSFGPSLTWLHHAFSQGSSDAPLTPEQKTNFYTLFKYLVKLFLGLALTFSGRKFATRLLRRDQPLG